ncbi:hypothetical protein QTP70_003796 [Hemibagrus guttatus]|uniref:Uncharacterized protein n=1 Tax=Hemibagrus guttatus TaxID=175788 RepID=A0AAE0QU19_9TELE|nr:hypothetical protein QTP70_003796 [Hemibagrus guttatus]
MYSFLILSNLVTPKENLNIFSSATSSSDSVGHEAAWQEAKRKAKEEYENMLLFERQESHWAIFAENLMNSTRAMALSIALELIIKAEEEEKENKDSTLDMMRRVFAEEKASGVRDSMDEYMNCLHMYLHQPIRVLEETQRLEKQLSEQLTRLKNSMLYDNKMSSRSLKHWANGNGMEELSARFSELIAVVPCLWLLGLASH